MSSVNYGKCHGASETKAKMRHCDKQERLKHEHSNKDINKDMTKYNMQWYRESYEDTCKKYDAQIACIDAKAGGNKRKDRVTCMDLVITVPENLPEKDYRKFFKKAVDLIGDLYGYDNIMQSYVHMDEIHNYKDPETGEMRTSRVHCHTFVVPEHNGKLNGKWCSARRNMIKLNNAIDDMCKREFGVPFMDGTKKKSRKTVEQLKNESQIREVMDELEEREIKIKRRENALDARESILDRREQDLHDLEAKASESQNTALQTQMAAERMKKEYEELLEEEKRQLKETLDHCANINAAQNKHKQMAMMRAIDMGVEVKSPKPVKDIGMEIQ